MPHHHGPGVGLPDVVVEAVAEVGVEAAGAGAGAALRAADGSAVAARHEAEVADTRRAHVRGHQVLQQLGHVHAGAALGTRDLARLLGEAPAVSRQLEGVQHQVPDGGFVLILEWQMYYLVSWSITDTNLEAQHAGVEVLHHGVEVAVGHVREEDGQLLLDPALPAAAAQAEQEVS